MPRQFVSKEEAATWLRRRVRAGAATLAACSVLLGAAPPEAIAADAPSSRFETVFSTKGEPAALYYKVAFNSSNSAHSLQVWREGQSRLRRRTDDSIDTYVLRSQADPGEYEMIVVDYQKRLTTRIDRNNLIRLGHFSDWFDLAHGLRHPVGAYRLSASEAPAGVAAPLAACRWYELAQEKEAHRICWSEQDRLPLVIWSPQRGVVWRVTEIERRAVTEDTFRLHDGGFVRNDANSDIDND